MNIAFTSIVIFFILAPGFLFRISYHSSHLSIRSRRNNLVNSLALSIIPGIVIQVLFLMLVENVTTYSVDFSVLGNLLLGNNDPSLVSNSFYVLRRDLWNILFYNSFLFLVAFLGGHFCRLFIRVLRFDRRFRTLRFSNRWFYIMRGECLDFPHVPDSFGDIDFRSVDVLCRVGNQSVIYIGEMFDYYTDEEGNLEAIHLRYPFRRDFEDDGDDEGKYYEIPSRFLIIPMKDIININIRYFNLALVGASELESIEDEEIIDLDSNGTSETDQS